MIEANTINNMDCLDGLAQMPDGCAKLIVADPPYFMGLTHNGQHGQFNDLAVAKPFYRQLAQQLRRILNDHGEFYIFMDWRGCAFYYPIFAISIHALLAESDSKSAQNSGALLRI